MAINLKVPEMKELRPRITVLGVGGAGGNAVNNMIEAGLEGVDFVVANTDAQALAQSKCNRRIQLGTNTTEGLGAGAQPDVGRAGAEPPARRAASAPRAGTSLGAAGPRPSSAARPTPARRLPG